MITDYLCFFLGLCLTSVYLAPVIFICGVNCFFPLAIRGNLYVVFGLECSWEGPLVFHERARTARGFSQL